MVIRAKKKNSKLIIDLTGPQGNAFFLLGAAKNYSRQLGLNYDQINKEIQFYQSQPPVIKDTPEGQAISFPFQTAQGLDKLFDRPEGYG